MRKYLPYIIISACLFLHCSNAMAQYQQLVHKTRVQRLQLLLGFYQDSLRLYDSATIFIKVNAIKKIAEDEKDDELLMESAILRSYYFYGREKFPVSIVVPMLDSLQSIASRQNMPWAELQLENMLAVFSFDRQLYEIAFQHYQKLYTAIKDLSPIDYPLKQNNLVEMGERYYFFGDYQQSIFYNKQALQAEPPFKTNKYRMRLTALNTLGLVYQKLNMLDSSDIYFKEANKLALQDAVPIWDGISSGNLGYNLFLRKKYDEAIPLLKKDIHEAVKFGDWGLASGSMMVLANINLQQNNITEAKQQIDSCRKLIEDANQYQRFQHFYPLLCKYYAAVDQPGLSALYLDSSLFVKDSLAKRFSALQLLRSKQKTEYQEQQAEMENIRHLKKLNELQRNSLLIAVVAGMCLFLFLYNALQKKYKRKQEELLSAKKQLDDFARHITEKNELIQLLNKQNQDAENGELILQIQQTTILTDADWEYFRQLFEKVHPGFFTRLREKMPGLSPADTRFIALSKLKFNNKEMAAMLGVGTEAIRQNRSRLKKKLNLHEEVSIEDEINNI
ncbi:MAG: hypothetical protein QM737_08075 [Ferruginibacter sp.]